MAKGKSPAFQFYPDAWLASSSVTLMTPAEEGAYIRLLCHSWQAEDCGIPDDDESLAELSRLRGQWEKSGHKIRAKFVAIGGRLFNNRLIEERQKQLEWRRKSSEGGKKSKANSKGGSTTIATILQPPLQNGCGLVDGLVATKRQPTPQPNIDSSSSSSSLSLSSFSTEESQSQNPCASGDARGGELFALDAPEKQYGKAWFDASFSRWYQPYWNKTGKQAARKAYEKRVKILVHAGGTHEGAEGFLCSQLQDYRKRFEFTESWSWRVNMHPATWINGEAWEDLGPDARASPLLTKSAEAAMRIADNLRAMHPEVR